jgi:hypothetical protein
MSVIIKVPMHAGLTYETRPVALSIAGALKAAASRLGYVAAHATLGREESSSLGEARTILSLLQTRLEHIEIVTREDR